MVGSIFARERRDACDPAVFHARMSAALSQTVHKQEAAGINVVRDGATSRISRATHVKERGTRFDNDGPPDAPADRKTFPGFLKRLPKAAGC